MERIQTSSQIKLMMGTQMKLLLPTMMVILKQAPPKMMPTPKRTQPPMMVIPKKIQLLMMEILKKTLLLMMAIPRKILPMMGTPRRLLLIMTMKTLKRLALHLRRVKMMVMLNYFLDIAVCYVKVHKIKSFPLFRIQKKNPKQIRLIPRKMTRMMIKAKRTLISHLLRLLMM